MSSAPSSSKPNRAFPHLSTSDKPTLEDVAKLIKDGKAKRIMLMVGAGVSTGAGIPDFRSPGTGLYDNLAKEAAIPMQQLTHISSSPEAIFDVDYLQERPEAFYTLAQELYPGNFRPTLSHYFFRLLQEKSVLRGCWTQNIDTLEHLAGLKDELLVEAHGSFAAATCMSCRRKFDKDDIKPRVLRGEVVRHDEGKCKGNKGALIKPDIVFFGEGLPDKFFERLSDFSSCDLLIVIGTSLQVGPFNSLMHRVPATCPRLLINMESVGEVESPRGLGFDFTGFTGKPGGIRDVRRLGDADEGIMELARLVGWDEDLRELKEKELKRLDEQEGKAAPAPAQGDSEQSKAKAEEKRLEVIEQVEKTVDATEGKEADEAGVDELTKAVAGVALDGDTAETQKDEEKNPAL
ncbi:Sir2 histone deacetylase Hst2 [Rhodotorula toruloides]